ncbi:hypothetical protein ACQR18_06480 [Bradyrhizobium oligotrophicum]|uniref:hypothetical protein n=1 Tax=Bradyrhizobium oligotrophicum TaxID=44255 RepID=UPI003EB7C227
MTKLVYLDSNDFSDLSKPPDLLTEPDKVVLAALRSARASGRATFFISPIHLSESVHASTEHKESAVRRAELMTELGGSNTLRLPTEICREELQRALSGTTEAKCSFSEICSEADEWFGNTPESNLNQRRSEIADAINGALRQLSRAERRKKKSELNPKRKSAHSLIRATIKKGLQLSPPTKIPMELLNPDLVIDWYLGEVSDAEYRKNSLRILNDHKLLFKYLVDELGFQNQLYSMIRTHGLKWQTLIESGLQQLAPLLVDQGKIAQSIDLRSVVSSITNESFLRKIIGALSEEDLDNTSFAQIKAAASRSPSTTILLHIVTESILSRLQSTLSRALAGNLAPVRVKSSDYGDFMHAIYAPYFDVFRCDAAVGEGLRRHRLLQGKVFAKRRDLIDALTSP